MTSKNIIQYLILFFVLFLFIGCGQSTVSVTGEVFYDGKPAPDISVLFEPKSESTRVADAGLAVTDSGGRFRVFSTGAKKRNGIELGEYTVFMGWKNPDATDDIPEGATIKPVNSLYKFPEKLINGNVVITVNRDSNNRFVFRVTADDITWE
ncbi:MAG: DUF4198 domain-containing protein [Planctomycetaceae bacterium]|jgi:hypothetical protein|nr:DUF4198 domain-containing protein [Planctomycetaceae bacterium]